MPLGSRTLLERYEVLAPLGAGGMGEVYRARDLRLGREVAIKVLPEHLADDPSSLARFEREARAIAALSHPNLLAIYDFGADGGVSFAVTELLHGETLRGALAPGPLPWRRAAEIGANLAEGLAAAHSRGIVHRDLKPDNVFVTTEGRIKILDFGLARWVEEESRGEGTSVPTTPDPTRPGTVLGTVGYMAPEQVRGEPADARSDIFAFGCVLHEMLAGRPAFTGSSAFERMAAILRDEPPRPSLVSPDIPPDLDRLLARCLEKAAAKRPASAAELVPLLRDLASAGASEPTVVAGAPLRVAAKRPSRSKSLAVLPFLNPGGDSEMEYLAEGITESLINDLAQLRRLRVMATSTMFRFRGDADPQDVGRQLGVGTVLSGRVTPRGSSLAISVELVDASNGFRLWGARYDRPIADLLAVQEEIAREISSNLKVTLEPEHKKRLAKRYTADRDAYPLYLKGRFHWNKSTVPSIRKAIEYFEQAIEKDPAYALAWAGLSDCWAALAMDRFAAVPPREGLPEGKRRGAESARDRRSPRGSPRVPRLCGGARLGVVEGGERIPAGDQARSGVRARSPLLRIPARLARTVRGVDRRIRARARARSAVSHHQQRLRLGVLRRAPLRRGDRSASPHDRDGRRLPADLPVARARLPWRRAADGVRGGVRRGSTSSRTEARRCLPVSLWRALQAGDTTAAERILADMKERAKTGYVPMVAMVQLHLALHDIDGTFEWLDKAFAYRASFLVPMKVYPFFDKIRDDPRFRELLRGAGHAA